MCNKWDRCIEPYAQAGYLKGAVSDEFLDNKGSTHFAATTHSISRSALN